MATKEEHINKRDCADFTRSELHSSVNKSRHADWVVTISFYKALHAVESFLVTKGLGTDRHRTDEYGIGRNDRARRNLSRHIYKKYKGLYEASRQARYEGFTFEDKPQEVEKIIERSNEIQEYIEPFLRRVY